MSLEKNAELVKEDQHFFKEQQRHDESWCQKSFPNSFYFLVFVIV